MKKLLLILLCLPMIGFGQGWEVTLGGSNSDIGMSVQQTIDGGYIITGMTYSFGGGVYLVKTDANGVEQWYNTFASGYGNSVKQTMDGGYIISGYTFIDPLSSTGHMDLYLIKTDGNGVEQWSQHYDSGVMSGEQGHSVQQTTDGGYIITGWMSEFGSKDIWLIKTDGNGQEQWSQTFVGPYDMKGSSVQQTTDGGYIIAGACDCPTNGILIKTDGNGIEQWSQNLGGTGNSVQQTTDGGYIITGKNKLIGFPINWNIWLSKTDGNGVEQWSQTYGGSKALSVQQTSDGGFIMVGDSAISSVQPVNVDVYLIKTDNNGNELWNQSFGGIGVQNGRSVQQTTDGGYIITGWNTNMSDTSDVYLIKTDANGNITSTFNIPINPNRKLEKVVDMLGRNTKGKKNEPLFYIYDDGIVEKRIVIE